jgi:tetratricopeptide (TPR) repeat protein
VARKHKHGGPPQLSLGDLETRVRRSLGEGRSQHALEFAKQLYKQDPTPPHKELLRKVYLERAQDLRRQGYTRDATTVLENAAQLGDGDPTWLAHLAEELAAAGNARRAVDLLDRLPETPARARVLAQAVDTALGQGPAGRSSLPPTLQGAFDLVVRAFAHAEAGQDDQARQTLQGIGLLSPFLEWKLLLRGLLAFYQNDDSRTLENWQRLDPQRLPARLAAPLRFLIDPAFRQAQPPEAQAALQKKADRLQGSGLVQPLRNIQADLVDTEKIPQAFRLADNLLAALRREAPQLVPRLAACFYWAIITTGQPEDMNRFRRTFGEPPDDPHLDRLQALAYENLGDPPQAHKHWQRYERWLAENPGTFPAPAGAGPRQVADRARALIWCHMGHNAARVPDLDKIPDLPPFLRDHPSRPRPLSPGAEHCFRRSLELAPDLLDGYQALFRHYKENDEDDQAARTARQLLERFPDHVATLQELADLRMKHGNYSEALGLFQRALKVNPLDRRLRAEVGTAHLFNARAHAEAGRFAEARAEYQGALALKDVKTDVTVLCKWAACEFKAGDQARAEELLGQALAEPGHQLPVAFNLVIEAIRLKLLPALKTRFNNDFNAGLAEPPVAAAAADVAETAAAHRGAGVTYRGQKTHEKKVLAYLDKVPPAEFTDAQLEKVCTALLGLDALKALRTFAALGQRRFPGNAQFYFLEAESYIALGPNRCPLWKVTPLLEKASQLAAQLPPDDKQKALLEAIRQRQQMTGIVGPGGMGMLQDLFEGMFGGGDYWDDDDWDDDDWDDEGDDMPFMPFGPPPKRKKKKKKRR